MAIELGRGIEGGEAGNLRHVRRTDVDVLLQPLDRVAQVLWQHHPAQAPTSHAEVLAEAVHQHCIARGSEHRGRWPGVGDAVVDLVGDQLHVVGRAPLHHRCHALGRQHRARGIGRRGDHQPVELAGGSQQLGRGRPTGVGPDGNRHRLDIQRQQCIAVARVAGLEHPDAIAGIERGEEREREPCRGTGDDDHVVGRHLHAVRLCVVPADAPPQGHRPRRIRVAQWIGTFHCRDHSRACSSRGAGGRLPDLEMEHALATRLHLAGTARHRHGVKRRHVGSAECLAQHAGSRHVSPAR